MIPLFALLLAQATKPETVPETQARVRQIERKVEAVSKKLDLLIKTEKARDAQVNKRLDHLEKARNTAVAQINKRLDKTAKGK